MRKEKKYYKVVAKEGGRLISCMSRKEVEYKEGEWAEPYERDGPLAVFESYEEAEAFTRQYYGWEWRERAVGIYEAEIEEDEEGERARKEEPEREVLYYYYEAWKGERYRRGIGEKEKGLVKAGMESWKLPRGTVLAKKVKVGKER
jgi:hypothetical protein